MGMANDGGQKIQAVPLGRKFGMPAGTYQVEASDRVFQAVEDGTITVTLGDGTVVTGPVIRGLGHSIEKDTKTIVCDVTFNIG